MIYIAAPFFTPEQIKVVNNIKQILDNNKIEYFSPMDASPVVENVRADESIRQKIFNTNRDALRLCSGAIAVIDDFDKGTIWEMGFLYALGKPVLAYTSHSDRYMNIMLQFSVMGLVHGENGLEEVAGKIFG